MVHKCGGLQWHAWPRGATPCPRSGSEAGSARLRWCRNSQRSNPQPEARASGQEEQPHVQEVVAAWAQEGLEELLHVQGQEGRREAIPLVQGKRNPSKLPEGIRGQTH